MSPKASQQSKKFYYREGLHEYGPFTGKELRSEARSGRLTPNAYVRRDGEDKWLAALAMKSLEADFESAKFEASSSLNELEASRKKRSFRELIRDYWVSIVFVVALIVGVVVLLLPESLSLEQKRVVDGRAVHEWNRLTKITANEETGVVYNLLLATLKRHVEQPASVQLIGGHRVEALGCQLAEHPKYQAHVCSGRFRFKNLLGIEDETTYDVYFRKYETGEIQLDDVEIAGRIVQTNNSK